MESLIENIHKCMIIAMMLTFMFGFVLGDLLYKKVGAIKNIPYVLSVIVILLFVQMLDLDPLLFVLISTFFVGIGLSKLVIRKFKKKARPEIETNLDIDSDHDIDIFS